MKNYSIILGGLLMFSACGNDYEDTISNIPDEQLTPITRSANEWDESERCILSTGNIVNLPWANTTSGTIPTEIRKDVKQSDGWRLLYSTVKMIGAEHSYDQQNGANYILLYNRYTGYLKGFYYALSVQDNNNAYWHLKVPESNTKLFNFMTYFSKANDESLTQEVTLSTISTNGITNGFDNGWNCFMLELAYDENSMDETLDIFGFALNETTYDFSGSYTSTSEGTIISSVTTPTATSKTFDGIAGAFGKTAKDWIITNTATEEKPNRPIKNKLFSNILQSLTSAPMPSLISAGLNLIFGSLSGSTSSTTNLDLEFITDGHVTVTGKSSQPSSGYVFPLQGIPLNGIGERLGVWNLKEKPKFQIKKAAELVYARKDSYGGTDFCYKILGTPSLQIVTNPAAGISTSVSYSLVKYDSFDSSAPSFWTPNGGKYPELLNRQDLGGTQTLVYSGCGTQIWTMPQTYYILTYNNYPNKTTVGNIPAYNLYNGNYEVRQNIAFKVVARTYSNGSIKSYSCKTMIPVNEILNDGSARPYNWSYSDLVTAGYVKTF